MPMRIPPDAKVIRDSRITLIRVISTLYDRLVNGDDGLKDKVKATMREKDASFAESDLVIAALRAGSGKSTIDVYKLYRMVDAGELKLSQFLDCITVSKERLKEFLPGAIIDKLTIKGAAPAEPALFTEFKDGMEIDLDELATSLAGAIAKTVPIKLT
jgi:hypothetical protein